MSAHSIEDGERYLDETIGELRANAEHFFPGAKYAAIYSQEKGEMIYIPVEFAMGSVFGHAMDYGSGLFEGGSAVINERTGIPNVVLLDDRNKRMFERSLPARGYKSPISEMEMREAILTLIGLHDESLFTHPDGKTTEHVRAYIRPTIYPASLAGYGISLRKDYPIMAGVLAWAWPDYLRPELAGEGGIGAVTGLQRLFAITGKHASNYGAAVMDSVAARKLGADEMIYLAPYLIDENGSRYWADPSDLEKKLRDGVIADGPGEECIAISIDQKHLVYPPMAVNRLGGTVLQYIIDHMAENVGLTPIEANITLRDLKNGEYAGLAFVGNAVKVTPVRQLSLYHSEQDVEVVELFEKGQVPEKLSELSQRWEAETRGLIDASHESLLTEVPYVLK